MLQFRNKIKIIIKSIACSVPTSDTDTGYLLIVAQYDDFGRFIIGVKYAKNDQKSV